MPAQSRKFLPILTAVAGSKQSSILRPGENRFGILEGGFEMPHTLEFPWMWSAIIPFVSACVAFIAELIAYRLPAFSAIVGPLNHLTEPTTGLGSKDPIRFRRRTFDMVNLPAGKVWTIDFPPLAFAVGCQHEGAFTGADQYSNRTH